MAVTHHAALAVGGVPVLPGMGGLGIVAFRNVYFVDNKRGSDGETGLGVDQAFQTVQKALDTVQDEDTIVVFKGTGSYNEKLTTGQNIRHADMVPGRGRHVTLAGATSVDLPYNSPQLYNTSDTLYTLFIRSPGWRVTGFRIVGDSTAQNCLVAEQAQAGNTASTNWAVGLQVDHCIIYGYVTGTAGLMIASVGDCQISDNLFEGFAALEAIGDMTNANIVTFPGFTFPTVRILRNMFTDNANNIDLPCQRSEIAYNSVGRNRNNALALYGGIDLKDGGGDNIIYMNTLAGQWESGGQYRPAAASDDWGGNIVTSGVVNGVINPPWTSSAPDA